jgi:hypothetical protein
VQWRTPQPIYANPNEEATNTNARLQSGTLTFQRVFSEQEENWKTELRRRAEAARYIEDLSQEFDIPVEAISNVLPPGVLKAKGEETPETVPSKGGKKGSKVETADDEEEE